jgi:hypothetical protein
MKFWKVLIALLFLTTTLQAQIPFYGCPNSPYYPGAYYSGACYPQPYYPQPYYTQFPYYYDPFSTSYYDDTVNTLVRQIRNLSENVQQLQAEITLAQTQAPTALAPEAATPPSKPPATPVTFIFKDGKRIPSQGYAIMGQTMWILTPGGPVRVALKDIDVVETRKANITEVIRFQAPGNCGGH